MTLRMNVACDTPLGVEFATLEAARAPGKIIVTDRLIEKFAEARGWQPEDCELLIVTEEPTGRVMWSLPKPASLHEVAALLLARSNNTEDEMGEFIPQAVYDSLYKRGMLTTGADNTGEAWAMTTDEGDKYLRDALVARAADSQQEAKT